MNIGPCWASEGRARVTHFVILAWSAVVAMSLNYIKASAKRKTG